MQKYTSSPAKRLLYIMPFYIFPSHYYFPSLQASYMELKHTISADMKHCGSDSKLIAKCNTESKYVILLILVTLSGVTQKRISFPLCDVLSYATTYSRRVYVKVVSTWSLPTNSLFFVVQFIPYHPIQVCSCSF